MNAPFQLDREGKLQFLPEVIKLVPDLADLSEREINAIIYAIDYHNSPARMKPLDQRKSEAFKRFYRKEKLKDQELTRFNRGAEAYHGLIFDIRREKIDSYKAKILQMDAKILQDDTTPKQIQEIDSASKYLQLQIDEMERAYDADNEVLKMKKGKSMSMVEQWQANMAKFGEFRKLFEIENA